MSMRNFADSAQSAISSFFEAVARSHEAMFAAWAAIESDFYKGDNNVEVTQIHIPDFVEDKE